MSDQREEIQAAMKSCHESLALAAPELVMFHLGNLAQRVAGIASKPSREDAVAAWLKERRDACLRGSVGRMTIDNLLNDYRLHADVGAPLSEHVVDGGGEE